MSKKKLEKDFCITFCAKWCGEIKYEKSKIPTNDGKFKKKGN